jgi:rRNA-processing protein CGR1
MSTEVETKTAAPAAVSAVQGMRKNGGFSSMRRIISVTGLTPLSTGKQWHQTKTAFRPTSGLTSFAKRQEEKKARDAVKAKEKELKDEKEAERQVRRGISPVDGFFLTCTATYYRYQDQARGEGRAGTLPEDGGEDAQEAR